jgi:hypothetical protein
VPAGTGPRQVVAHPRGGTTSALVVGCAEIEVSDCEDIGKRSDCDGADVEFGECRWVDVYTPFADAGSCDLGVPKGMCVGLSVRSRAAASSSAGTTTSPMSTSAMPATCPSCS